MVRLPREQTSDHMGFEYVSGKSSIDTALLEVLPAFLHLIDEGGSDVALDISIRRHIKSNELRAGWRVRE